MFLLAAFVLWTLAVSFMDVQPIGPLDSCVGFAALNQAFHQFTGVHLSLYVLTDWLGLVPFAIAGGFGLLGLCQWIKRKRFFQADHSLLVLGGFYLIVIAAYVLFEVVTVNKRPVLIEGILETSYPSSTTMLVLCVLPTAMMQFQSRIQNTVLRKWVIALCAAFTIFMVLGRLVSGVHWLTDIIGGGLLSAALVLMYASFSNL